MQEEKESLLDCKTMSIKRQGALLKILIRDTQRSVTKIV
jgi:hypothetical protein